MSNDAQVMTTRRPGRPKAGSEDKKARILAEALTLFSTRGYVATSLADIAASLFVEGPAVGRRPGRARSPHDEPPARRG